MASTTTTVTELLDFSAARLLRVIEEDRQLAVESKQRLVRQALDALDEARKRLG